MVRDRIAELCALRRNGSTFGRALLKDVHMPITLNKKVVNVLEEVEQIRELVQLVVTNVGIVKDLHNNVLSHTDPDIGKELESRTFIIGQTAQRIRNKLSAMAKDIPNPEDIPTLKIAREGPTHMRIKILQYTTVQQMFSDIMLDYNESLLRYHDKCSLLLNQQRRLMRKSSDGNNFNDVYSEEDETAERQSLFVGNEKPNLSSKSEGQTSRIFLVGQFSTAKSINFHQILEDSRVARQQLSDIQSRHEEVIKLEKSITEIHDIFLQMAYAIEKQGDRLNCVEYFAGKASENIDLGRSDLTKAETRSKRYRMRKCKIMICVAATVLILVIIAIYL